MESNSYKIITIIVEIIIKIIMKTTIVRRRVFTMN